MYVCGSRARRQGDTRDCYKPIIDKRTPPTDLAAGGRLTINTLTRGAERREEAGGAPDPSNPSKNEEKRLERGQKNPNHIMIWIFFDFEDPEQQKLHDGKHVVFEKSSPGTCFFISKS